MGGGNSKSSSYISAVRDNREVKDAIWTTLKDDEAELQKLKEYRSEYGGTILSFAVQQTPRRVWAIRQLVTIEDLKFVNETDGYRLTALDHASGADSSAEVIVMLLQGGACVESMSTGEDRDNAEAWVTIREFKSNTMAITRACGSQADVGASISFLNKDRYLKCKLDSFLETAMWNHPNMEVPQRLGILNPNLPKDPKIYAKLTWKSDFRRIFFAGNEQDVNRKRFRQQMIRNFFGGKTHLADDISLSELDELDENSENGGYAEVKRAFYKSDPVAIKILQDGDKGRQGIMNELLLLSTLSHHPGIIEIVGATTARNRDDRWVPAVVLKWAPFNLKNYVTSKKPEDVSMATRLSIAQQIGVAIRFLHQHDVIHVDLKPANCLVTEDQDKVQVQLCDFGSAVLLPEGTKSVIQKVETTAGYFFDEGMDKVVSRTFDIYSFGKIVYQVATWTPELNVNLNQITGNSIETKPTLSLLITKTDFPPEEQLRAIVEVSLDHKTNFDKGDPWEK